MEVVYLAGSYRDARGAYYIQRNIERARDCALWLWGKGVAVICPHMNTALLDGSCPDSIWLRGDIEIMKRCDRVYVLRELIGMGLGGHMICAERSSGVLAEIEAAKESGIPVTEVILNNDGQYKRL